MYKENYLKTLEAIFQNYRKHEKGGPGQSVVNAKMVTIKIILLHESNYKKYIFHCLKLVETKFSSFHIVLEYSHMRKQCL